MINFNSNYHFSYIKSYENNICFNLHSLDKKSIFYYNIFILNNFYSYFRLVYYQYSIIINLKIWKTKTNISNHQIINKRINAKLNQKEKYYNIIAKSIKRNIKKVEAKYSQNKILKVLFPSLKLNLIIYNLFSLICCVLKLQNYCSVVERFIMNLVINFKYWKVVL